MKNRFLYIPFLIGFICICACQNKTGNNTTKAKNNQFSDSILIYKTDTVYYYSFYSIDTETATWEPEISKKVNYHIINLKTKSLTFFFKTKNNRYWDKFKISFDSISKKENGTMFYYDLGSDHFEKTFLDTLNSRTITHVLNEDTYMRFTNLKQVGNDEIEKLRIREFSETGQEQKHELKQQSQSDNFEFSDYWRKEAFKKTIVFLKQKLREQTPSCTMVSRSTYNTNLISYIGQQGYRIKLFVEFDCNQNYINPSYFWVNAFYLGNGNWEMALIDQKLTH